MRICPWSQPAGRQQVGSRLLYTYKYKYKYKHDYAHIARRLGHPLTTVKVSTHVPIHTYARTLPNSLLDIVVFGRACANRINDITTPSAPLEPLPANAGEFSIDNLDKLRHSTGPLSTAEIRGSMQQVMQNHAAVFRVQDKLEEGVVKIDEVCKSMADVGITDRSMVWHTDSPSS